jgi:hypothetical protein
VHRLVEVVRRRRGRELAPQDVHDLLAMQPVIGSEREQLHELARLLQPPCRFGHRLAVNSGGKATEERDSDVGHRRRMPAEPAAVA